MEAKNESFLGREFNYIYHEPKRPNSPKSKSASIYNSELKLYDDARFNNIEKNQEQLSIANTAVEEIKLMLKMRIAMYSIESYKI